MSLSGGAPGYADVAVVGGGVIGCSVAYRAARRGARVVLFEAETVGSGASGAAAGMLSAQAEPETPLPLQDFLLAGRALHEPLSGTLLEETGIDVEYVHAGALHLARTEGDRERLRGSRRFQMERGLDAEWLESAEVRELEPALDPGVTAGLYLPEDAQLNPPRLVQALRLAAERRGARFEEGAPVRGLVTSGGRVTGVRTARGASSAGAVVLASGWASPALAEKLGIHLPVTPVKGEILAVRADPPPIRANVWSGRRYLVPKKHGRVVVGATEEPGISDRRPTLGGVADLSTTALRAVPALATSPLDRLWGGLRPGTPDGLPVIGAAEEWGGLVLATGHHRNGVLLSHLTGEIVASIALGEEAPAEISAFSPARFARARSTG